MTKLVAYMHGIDDMIADAKQHDKIVILTTRGYPSWVNNTYKVDPRYVDTVEPHTIGDPAKRFDPALFGVSLVDRGQRGGFKDARFRFPGEAVDANGQYSYAYDVGVGSNWYVWIKFLLARYHRDHGVYDRVALGRYANDNGLGMGSGLGVRSPDAYVDYFEFVNEPNGPEGWPQQDATGRLLVDRVVAGMFRSTKAAALELARVTSVRGPTLLGPAPADDASGSGRRATTVQMFTNALLADLGYTSGSSSSNGSRFHASDPDALFIWSQHNYGDVEQQRYWRWRGGEVNVKRDNAAALARDILLKRKWDGLRDAAGTTGPWVYLTEGGARLDYLERAHKGDSDKALKRRQAALLQRNWDEMSNRTGGGRLPLGNRRTGDRLGLGIGMLTNFLFYDEPPLGFNKSGLNDPPPPVGPDQPSPPPDDLGKSSQRYAYRTWQGLKGTPTPRRGGVAP